MASNRTLLVTRIMMEEGYKQYPYKDTQGVLTIGYGRNLESMGISQPEALYLLLNDLGTCEKILQKSFPIYETLTPARQQVLLDMCFNLGFEGMMKFRHMLACIAKQDYVGAATEMRDSLWATQVGKRAEALANMMETGNVA